MSKFKLLNRTSKLLIAFALFLSCLSSHVIYENISANVEDDENIALVDKVPEVNDMPANYEEMFAYTGELNITTSHLVNEDKQHVDLVVNATSDNEEIKILSVRGPDGTAVEGNEFTYTAPCNGIYEFIIEYEKDGEELVDVYYDIVNDSSATTDGNKPSKANGWYTGLVGNYFADLGEGTINLKPYPYNITVSGDGETKHLGPGNPTWAAYMVDNDGVAVLCMEPMKLARPSFDDYTPKKIGADGKIYGEGGRTVYYEDLQNIWFYGQIKSQQYASKDDVNYNGDEWTFITQVMLWEALGYSVDYPAQFNDGVAWVNEQIGNHSKIVNDSKTGADVYLWRNGTWEGDDAVGCIAEIDGACYVNKDGEINPNGSYVPFNPWEKVLSFSDPSIAYGGTVTLKDLIGEDGQPVKNPDGSTARTIDQINGGTIYVVNAQEIHDRYYPLYNANTDKVTVEYSKESSINGGNNTVYKFTMASTIGEGETEKFTFSYVDEWIRDESTYSYEDPIAQDLMQFKMLDNYPDLPFTFSKDVNVTVPEQPEEEQQPKDLKAPDLHKIDFDDGFDVEHALFTFRAGETFEIHYQVQKTTGHYETDEEGNEYIVWDEPGEWEDKDAVVWAKGDEVMDEARTDANGLIDTAPIIQNYYDAYAEKQADEFAKWEDKESELVLYDEQLHPDYLDVEGIGWIGGQFYAMEPETSQNFCNSVPTGTPAGTCQNEFDGYLNLNKGEKIKFEISEQIEEGETFEHENERQRGRITVHKVDNETLYLNHNNDHEPQGDGYFYGSVFVLTAREDIVLHNGAIPNSPFTGKPLYKGEIADIMVLQVPMDENGNYQYDAADYFASATSQMLELGQYAIQEVRWPGVYKADLPLKPLTDTEYRANMDGLYHVDPAAAQEVIDGLLNKNSEYYEFDYDKATDLYNHGIIPIDSPDGGYWFKDYHNGLANTSTDKYAFVGGQTVDVDVKYSGEDHSYNEIIPDHNEDRPGNVSENGETVDHIIPPVNTMIGATFGDGGQGDVKFPVEYVHNAGLDYENSIQKGHIQFIKRLTEAVGILPGGSDNTGVDPDFNIPGKDIYFGIYLDRKGPNGVKDSTNELELVDKYFAQERVDGLKYVFDGNGNFQRYKDKTEQNGAITEYIPCDINDPAGLVMVSVDGTATGANFQPADNYYTWETITTAGGSTAVVRRNSYVNPYREWKSLNAQNLSDKELYMILKTDSQGRAGTNYPESIVWANYGELTNTELKGNYGNFNIGLFETYSKEHAEVLDYIYQVGLPLPYGTYTVVEMNAPQGYESVSWKAEISKNLTTYDINEETTVWELGIEKDYADTDVFSNDYARYVEHLSDTTSPLGWAPKQTTVEGVGELNSETWLNKQFHVFSDYVSTSRWVGTNIEDKLHRQVLQVVKIDAESGRVITANHASFRLWQWNSVLELNEEWMHAEYNKETGDWRVWYEIPTYDANGNITDTTVYEGTEWYTDSKGLTLPLGQWINIPANGTGIYTTDDNGQVTLEQPLPAGHYFLLETKAPEGYLLNTQPVPFNIEWVGGTTEPNEGDSIAVPEIDGEGNFVCQAGKDCNTNYIEDENGNEVWNPEYAYDEDGNLMTENVQWRNVPNFIQIIVSLEDMPQKGYVEVEKRGSIFDKFTQYVDGILGLIGYKPTWTEESVVKLNTSFCVYAAEDIVVNGDVKFEAGECIQKMYTTDEGHAYSEALYLGKYYVQECEAPHGYITNEEPMHFELTYDEQKVIVHPEFKDLVNKRKKFEIELFKTDEEGNPLADAIFGIFAGEDLPRGFVEEEPSFVPTELLPVDYTIFELHEDGTATILGTRGALPGTRYIIPDVVTIEGKQYTVTGIGQNAFAYTGLNGIVIPHTVEWIGDGAFTENPDLDFVQFLGEVPPTFETDNIFPSGSWEQECHEDENGITCDIVYNPGDNELLGIYIPWHALSAYDLAIVNGMADNAGSKDQRLMGIPLKDDNNIFNEDPEFTRNPFDTNGFANLGKVEYSRWTREDADLFDYTFKTKEITHKDGSKQTVEGYFITGFKEPNFVWDNSQPLIIPESIFLAEGCDSYGAAAVCGAYEQRIVGIDAGAFDNEGLISVLIPDTIEYIGDRAFAENEDLTTVRFYETEYVEYEEDDNMTNDPTLPSQEEECFMTGGYWRIDKFTGKGACFYTVDVQDEMSAEECTALNGTYDDVTGICTYKKESTGEMPEEPNPGNPGEDGNMGVVDDPKASCEAAGGQWNGITCLFDEEVDGGMGVVDDPKASCEAAGGRWSVAVNSCVFDTDVDFEEENCAVSGGTWNGTTCLYGKEVEIDACKTAGGTWNGTSCDMPSNDESTETTTEETTETTEEQTGVVAFFSNLGKTVVETVENLISPLEVKANNSSDACIEKGGQWDAATGTCKGGQVDLGDLDEGMFNKSTSQIVCEAQGGTWDLATGTCTGATTGTDGDGYEWPEDGLDSGMDYDHRTNSQKVCEAEGGVWDEEKQTCSTAEAGVLNHDVFIAESAFDFTPNLTWIIAGENAWHVFDTAYIIDEDDKVLRQDELLDGFLYWNPELTNPYTGKPGYWEFAETMEEMSEEDCIELDGRYSDGFCTYGGGRPALMDYPITINHLVNEDWLDPGISGPIVDEEGNPTELPAESTGIKEGTLIEVVKTDKDGHAVTTFDYPEGKYYVRELKAPAGYEVNYDIYEVELEYQDMNEEPVITVKVNGGQPIINEKLGEYPLRIEIIKTDGVTTRRLEGAVFQLWNKDRTTILEDNLVTDSLGTAITKGLYSEHDAEEYYWVKEVKAPEGYEIRGDGWTKVTVDHFAEVENYTTTVVIENFKPTEPEKPTEPGEPERPTNPSHDTLRVKLLKEMEGNLDGAWKDVVFGIFAAEDIYTGRNNDRLVYEEDEMLTSGHINKDGIFNVLLDEDEFRLADGKYYVQEIKTNENYVLNGEKFYFEYNREEDGKHAVVEINGMEPIINELKDRDLAIRVEKVDEQDHSKHLDGAKFILVQKGVDLNGDGKVAEEDAIDTQWSNANGFATFDGLQPGTYWVKEIEAPEGYTLNPYWRKVVLTEDGDMKVSAEISGTGIATEVVDAIDDIVTIVWTNAPKKATETGANDGLGMTYLMTGAAALGIVVLLVIKKKREEA